MLIHLSEIESGKPKTKTIVLENEIIETTVGNVAVGHAEAVFVIQVDPLGWAVHYKVTADTTMNCVRCGGELAGKIKVDDWFSLRKQQPKEAHVVLEDSELSIRFISEPEIDGAELTKEIIELELPSYPRHDESDPTCRGAEEPETEPVKSPFQALSKFLDK